MSEAQPIRRRGRSLYAKTASVMRWLHIYLSMVSFAALMFFAVTGITLNHPTWLGADAQTTRDHQGGLPSSVTISEQQKLEIAETLRSRHALRGRVVQFEIGEADCMVVFKSPGYSADVFIDKASGKYQITETLTGWVAIMNDLHKGRDSGPGWSWVIDVSAVAMILVSITGFALLLFLRLRRAAGLLAACAGTILIVVAWALLVP